MSSEPEEASARRASVDFFGLSDVGKLLPELGLASTVVNVLTLALPVVLVQVYDRILPGSSAAPLGLLVAGMVVALVLEAFVRIGRGHITAWLGASFEHRLSCAAFKRLLRAPLPDIEREGVPALMERLHAATPIREVYSGQALLALFDLPFVLVALGLIGFLGGWLVAVPVVLGAAFLAAAAMVGGRVRRDTSRRAEFDQRRFSFLAETLAGHHTIRALAMEPTMQRRFEMLQDVEVETNHDGVRHAIAARDLAQAFAQVTAVAMAAAGAWLVAGGRMSPGALAACIVLAGSCLAPLDGVLGTWVRFRGFAAARGRIERLFALGEAAGQRPDLPPVEGALVLDGIAMSYEGAARPVLDGVSLALRPGECVAITGPCGSGKSTLLGILAGIVRPTAGRVLVDGHDLAEHAPASAAQVIATLPQQGLLVDGSILDNITMFNPALDDTAVQVAAMLGLDRAVAGMRLGFDTPVGSGDALSAGIRQRIAIARALVHDPVIVLFDEADFGMDAAGAELLRQYLAGLKGRKTMVLATDRPSLLALADRVFELSCGRLAEPAPRLTALVPPGTDAALPGRPEPDDRMTAAVLGRYPVLSDLGLCLPTLLKALDWRGTPRQLAEAQPYFAPSLDLAGLRRVMANLGYAGRSVRLRMNAIDPRILPCLFVPEKGDALVLVRYEDGRFFAFNGRKLETGYVSPAALDGEAHVFRPAEPEEAGRGLGLLVDRFRPMVALALALSVGINLLMLLPPLFVMAQFDGPGDARLVISLLLGLAAAFGLDWLARRLRARVLAHVGARAEYLAGGAVFRRILGQAEPMPLARLKEMEAAREMLAGPAALLMLELPAALVFVVALGVLEPWLLAVVAGAGACYGLLALAFRPGVAARLAAAARAGAQREDFLTDALAKMRAIRQAGAETGWFERFRLLSGKAVAAEYAAARGSARLAELARVIGRLTAMAALAVAAIRVVEGAASPGVAVASLLIATYLVAPVQATFRGLPDLLRAAGGLRRLDALMRTDIAPPARPGRSFTGAVQFAHVAFRYSEDADPALRGISLRVEPGRVVAITGPNGAGKSTLLKLVAGLYTPQSGSVSVDDVDIRQLDPGALRAAMSYAPQRCDLFFGTIAQNLRLAHPTASDDELRWACRLAGLLDEIEGRAEGLDTRLTGPLSDGFRRRLVLARAYLKPAPLLLLDEPGAGLDEAGDLAFQAALARLRTRSTILMVTHRPHHLRLADTVVYMEEGSIREIGTFDQLKTIITGYQR